VPAAKLADRRMDRQTDVGARRRRVRGVPLTLHRGPFGTRRGPGRPF
jgi:hypothetical protein